MHGDLRHDLTSRFGDDFQFSLDDARAERLAALASHRVQRDFLDKSIDPGLLKALCACALSAPSKSDLQQRDLVIVEDPDLRRKIGALMPHYPWVGSAPAMVIFCLNGRRLQQFSEWRGKPFPNNHFDLLFNAATDAAIALGWFQLAVEMAGLGGCPVSEFRNHAALISGWLGLPDKVAIYAGFCLGWPASDGQISPRLPLSATLHHDRFSDEMARAEVERYAEREAAQPARRQRDTARWGEARTYSWSEDKARQYAEPLRTNFGAYLRARKFNFD